eukprot:344091-Chlamydomonas_euryale.AAC.1
MVCCGGTGEGGGGRRQRMAWFAAGQVSRQKYCDASTPPCEGTSDPWDAACTPCAPPALRSEFYESKKESQPEARLETRIASWLVPVKESSRSSQRGRRGLHTCSKAPLARPASSSCGDRCGDPAHPPPQPPPTRRARRSAWLRSSASATSATSAQPGRPSHTRCEKTCSGDITCTPWAGGHTVGGSAAGAPVAASEPPPSTASIRSIAATSSSSSPALGKRALPFSASLSAPAPSPPHPPPLSPVSSRLGFSAEDRRLETTTIGTVPSRCSW